MALFDDSRSDWNAAASTNPVKVSPGSRVGISWHYPGGSTTITPSSDHSRCLSQVKAWQRLHMSSPRNWADIGYNLLICQHARVIEGRGVDMQGAHSPGVNYEHYGVQFMTNQDDGATPAMYARGVRLRADLEARSGKKLRQWGHRDDPKASTACPGDTIERWVKSGGPYASAAVPEEDIMATIDELRAVIRQELTSVPDAVWNHLVPSHDPNPDDNVKPDPTLTRSNLVMSNYRGMDNQASLAKVLSMLTDIGGKVGADVDEAAVAAALAPVVRQAVLDSGQPEAVANAVVAKLGAALTPKA